MNSATIILRRDFSDLKEDYHVNFVEEVIREDQILKNEKKMFLEKLFEIKFTTFFKLRKSIWEIKIYVLQFYKE